MAKRRSADRGQAIMHFEGLVPVSETPYALHAALLAPHCITPPPHIIYDKLPSTLPVPRGVVACTTFFVFFRNQSCNC